ncbi:hypothetical protein FISHEDRAFT_57859 [Fistulina hepatica ATCC 64428]|uniref:Uncharacterized protein n=1 Tax=Fistulina hepatica ATCC 64428 TaxID=1128425 RepID=A0A0D7AF54_9AGAR|nr:hypothetical protein FISHEDRAFT_57859 [Fistulina hepatica ATCC 64428]
MVILFVRILLFCSIATAHMRDMSVRSPYPSVSYSGSWHTESVLAVDGARLVDSQCTTQDPDVSVSFTFTGSAIYVDLPKPCPVNASASFYVDSSLVSVLNLTESCNVAHSDGRSDSIRIWAVDPQVAAEHELTISSGYSGVQNYLYQTIYTTSVETQRADDSADTQSSLSRLIRHVRRTSSASTDTTGTSTTVTQTSTTSSSRSTSTSSTVSSITSGSSSVTSSNVQTTSPSSTLSSVTTASTDVVLSSSSISSESCTSCGVISSSTSTIPTSSGSASPSPSSYSTTAGASTTSNPYKVMVIALSCLIGVVSCALVVAVYLIVMRIRRHGDPSSAVWSHCSQDNASSFSNPQGAHVLASSSKHYSSHSHTSAPSSDNTTGRDPTVVLHPRPTYESLLHEDEGDAIYRLPSYASPKPSYISLGNAYTTIYSTDGKKPLRCAPGTRAQSTELKSSHHYTRVHQRFGSSDSVSSYSRSEFGMPSEPSARPSLLVQQHFSDGSLRSSSTSRIPSSPRLSYDIHPSCPPPPSKLRLPPSSISDSPSSLPNPWPVSDELTGIASHDGQLKEASPSTVSTAYPTSHDPAFPNVKESTSNTRGRSHSHDRNKRTTTSTSWCSKTSAPPAYTPTYHLNVLGSASKDVTELPFWHD